MPDIRCKAQSFIYDEATQALRILGLAEDNEIVIVSIDDDQLDELLALLRRSLSVPRINGETVSRAS